MTVRPGAVVAAFGEFILLSFLQSVLALRNENSLDFFWFFFVSKQKRTMLISRNSRQLLSITGYA
jgi:hypothetical protein